MPYEPLSAYTTHYKVSSNPVCDSYVGKTYTRCIPSQAKQLVQANDAESDLVMSPLEAETNKRTYYVLEAVT